MKFFLALALSFLCLVGCQKSSKPNALNAWMGEMEKVKVLSTTAMVEDLVTSVGGDEIVSLTLIKGEVDPHSYELVKGDGEKFECADLIYCNGLGLEHGASVRTQLERHQSAVFIGDRIAERVPEKILESDGVRDPHLWMDISLWVEGVDAIVEGLVKQRPGKKEYFELRAAALKAKMRAKHQELRGSLMEVPEKSRYLVTSHDAFHYFTRAYLAEGGQWEERCAAPEGLAPDGQLSSSDIQRIVDHLCQFHIPVVFPESNVSRDSLKKIVSACNSKGLKVSICEESLYGDAMGEASDYLNMMEHNAKTIRAGWEGCDERACH
ncbi:MAG: Periplasmic zinc-binding protein TroA [Chlamydiae bacterium]|nr:Periplasmic zinc-binding protein TroA [Chlamydiota bacterium]